MNLIKFYIYIIICATLSCAFTGQVHAYSGKGNIRKLTGLSDSMGRMDAQGKEEGINYQKADVFLNSKDIRQGISGEGLIKICGEPVAKADNGSRWVYKPPTSTFFEGEKIYFYFDADQKLTEWKKVYQK
jgi:hypothetical protein